MSKKTFFTLRTVALVCLLALLAGAFSSIITAAEYEFDEPVDKDMWVEANFDDPSTYAYSFAFVGDTQCLTIGDRLLGTNHLERLYKYIADTAEEKKLAHVFALGDITEVSHFNDHNLISATGSPLVTEEWEIAQKAIFQLNGKVKYNLCRGNHDDYMMDDYFNVPEYTDQFKGEGGFFADPNPIYPGGGRNKEKNPTGTIYWSAVTGAHDTTIVNSWRTMELYGTKYLFITIDYNPTEAVAKWVDQTLAKYPDHKAIITTHAYLSKDGEVIPTERDASIYPTKYSPEYLWEKVFSKHANVFMIVSGHVVTVNTPIYTVNMGKNGNKVYQFVINPQTYDYKEPKNESAKPTGTQDQGLVMYMNFSEDGNTISLNYYSTLLGKFLKDANYKINVAPTPDEDGSIDLAALSDYGQSTPLITEKKTPKLDGTINEGEYSEVRVTKQADIAEGKILSDLTEYFAYDDEYIYYAVDAKMASCSMDLHLGSSLYFLDELKDGSHSNKITLKFGTSDCTVAANDCYSLVKNNQDVFCKSGTNPTTKNKVVEVKISRKYLLSNNSPDNLLSYTLNTGMGTHRFNINKDANAYLKSLGVEEPYEWTYNYVYFGSRPETVEEPPETEPASSNDATDSKDGGCGAILSAPSILFVAALAGASVVVKKKKK